MSRFGSWPLAFSRAEGRAERQSRNVVARPTLRQNYTSQQNQAGSLGRWHPLVLARKLAIRCSKEPESGVVPRSSLRKSSRRRCFCRAALWEL